MKAILMNNKFYESLDIIKNTKENMISNYCSIPLIIDKKIKGNYKILSSNEYFIYKSHKQTMKKIGEYIMDYKWTVKDANFDENTGISTVTITTFLGDFLGKSKLHEEDRDLISNYVGCQYAEWRAAIKFFKAIIKHQETKVETLKNLINNLRQLKGYNENAKEMRYIRKQYYLTVQRLTTLYNTYEDLQNRLYEDMQTYRDKHNAFLEKINKTRESNEN